MSNSKRRCKHCREYATAESSIKVPIGWFCSDHCLQEWIVADREKARTKQKTKDKREQKSKDKSARAKHRDDKERVRSRSEWYSALQTLVNQYVCHVRDKDEPCCTCGKHSLSVKYDAGHYHSRGRRPELRFELTNIHKQCSVECNQYGSGKKAEYIVFIRNKYGQEHLDWLDGPQPKLKEQFPHYLDIKDEIIR